MGTPGWLDSISRKSLDLISLTQLSAPQCWVPARNLPLLVSMCFSRTGPCHGDFPHVVPIWRRGLSFLTSKWEPEAGMVHEILPLVLLTVETLYTQEVSAGLDHYTDRHLLWPSTNGAGLDWITFPHNYILEAEGSRSTDCVMFNLYFPPNHFITCLKVFHFFITVNLTTV